MGTHDGLSLGGVVGDTYRVTRLLGRGGMGAVWAAEHLRLPGREVAIKVLLSPGVASDESFARFRREAEIASRLGHPHIVQVLDFHTLPTGEPYIVLELLQGETLAQRLHRGPVALEETLAIARQVGSALQAAHRAGVVHRDLKPDNVFLCTPEEEMPGPRVKVLDFGISKIRGSQTVATQDAVLMGTPQYMAPEQALGRNTAIDPRTDVFALGAIVYEMLGGHPAFAGSSLAEVVYKVVHAQPVPLAQLRTGLPLNILSAVDRALQKDPAHRPVDVSTFVTELTGRPLTVPAAALAPGVLDATLASPARPIAVSSTDTDPTYTPATPVPSPLVGSPPRSTEALPARSPDLPWATPSPAGRLPSPWPSAGSPVPAVPRAALVGAPLATRPRRSIRRWLIAAVVLLAFIGVFRRANRDTSGDAERGSARKAQRPPSVPELPPLPPEAAQGVKQGLAEAKQGLNQGLQEMQREIRAALAKSPEAQQEEAKRLAEEAQSEAEAERAQALEEAKQRRDEARAAAKEVRAHRRATAGGASVAVAPEVRELLADAEEALDDEDPKLAIRLAEQSFFTRKTSAGYAIKARAHCQLKDLGGARAALANVTVKADRNRVLADCKGNGIDLR
jgi:eukaryotic-like serine/threonine-protein kinase